eukprot:TRINITY_DN1255_c0_g1_i4.p2 TRINITY_DN1255_c0_g1~~TRINITY_DN1255_c0_g1_i4.p2  ORF type:complete len:110 (-),score=21.86 TRINITY_DN1255_c0_g1_i4:366-695(-)
MGVLALADHFLGRVVSGLGGGGKKIFVMEEGDKQEGLVSPLHPSQYDLNPDNIINTASIPPEMEVQSRAEEIPDSGPFPIEEEKKRGDEGRAQYPRASDQRGEERTRIS